MWEAITSGYRSSFNRRGDSLGGATWAEGSPTEAGHVSIAGAILWGEQLVAAGTRDNHKCCFNRRGDSLGGATGNFVRLRFCVTFQSQGRFSGGSNCGSQKPQTKENDQFQSQGRFSGGSNIVGPLARQRPHRFNRRGDSLGGATMGWRCLIWRYRCFNRRGDSLGGATRAGLLTRLFCCLFQSQGRFSGGSNRMTEIEDELKVNVSIAGAILWGEQLNPFFHFRLTGNVSIAGAILWGEQLKPGSILTKKLDPFQSQGRFSGGSNRLRSGVAWPLRAFQSQGRFSGGSNQIKPNDCGPNGDSFNRRGDSLGGAT